ncbi:MAG: FG-GAP repeat protein, partial [Planctomycetota bacterium]
YLFDFSDPCNIIESKLTASDAAAGDQFGISVAISGNTAIVGAYKDESAGNNSCSAYVMANDSQCADPIELLLALAQDVIELNLQNGIENSLDAKLSAALGALQDVNENNNVAAINTLEAFINAVEAQRGDKIPNEADADALIAAAEEIIAILSGG